MCWWRGKHDWPCTANMSDQLRGLDDKNSWLYWRRKKNIDSLFRFNQCSYNPTGTRKGIKLHPMTSSSYILVKNITIKQRASVLFLHMTMTDAFAAEDFVLKRLFCMLALPEQMITLVLRKTFHGLFLAPILFGESHSTTCSHEPTFFFPFFFWLSWQH